MDMTLLRQRPFSILAIAAICHDANRRLCSLFGDHSQPLWGSAPDWQKESAINGVRFHLAYPHASPEASHENWVDEKVMTGWRYGPVKDADAKTHPCMVPFDRLPPVQQAKDHLFRAIVHALAPFCHEAPTPAESDRGEAQAAPKVGYRPHDDTTIEMVNANKRMEESILRLLDEMRRAACIDQRWLAIARTHFEEGFMAWNRAIMQPKRISLPDDPVVGSGS